MTHAATALTRTTATTAHALPATPLSQRLAAISLAAVMTLSALLSLDGLARHEQDAASAGLAQAAATAPRG